MKLVLISGLRPLQRLAEYVLCCRDDLYVGQNMMALSTQSGGMPRTGGLRGVRMSPDARTSSPARRSDRLLRLLQLSQSSPGDPDCPRLQTYSVNTTNPGNVDHARRQVGQCMLHILRTGPRTMLTMPSDHQAYWRGASTAWPGCLASDLDSVNLGDSRLASRIGMHSAD